MKRNLFFTVIVASLSANAFATIENATLVSHKEWTTGKISGHSKNVLSKKNPLALKDKRIKKPQDVKDYISAKNFLFDIYIDASDTTTEVSGYGSTYLSNSTDTSQTYKINTDLCIGQPAVGDYDCFITEDVVTLHSTGYVYLGSHPVVSYEFKENEGFYVAEIVTRVTRENSNTVYETYDGRLVEVP